MTVVIGGNRDGKAAKDGKGAKDGGDGGDDDDELSKLTDRMKQLNLNDCEFNRVWDKTLNAGRGAYRRCRRKKAAGHPRWCQQHIDMMLRRSGLGGS